MSPCDFHVHDDFLVCASLLLCLPLYYNKYKEQVNHKKVVTWRKNQSQCQTISLLGIYRSSLASALPRIRYWWWADMPYKKHYGIGTLRR